MGTYFQEDSSTKDNEIISLDSDDEDVLLADDMTAWYSKTLKTIERKYPIEFDTMIKSIIKTNPSRMRIKIQNVLGKNYRKKKVAN